MSQFNLNLTPEFEKALERFRRIRKLKSRSEAMRVAVLESLEREIGTSRVQEYSTWIGLGSRVAENPNRRFHSHDDLWREDHGR